MHAERINDRMKLAHHRVVARALARDPALLDRAREVVSAWKRERPHASFVEE